MELNPLKLYDVGFTSLVSVVPPGASLSPNSKLQPGALGKTPGRRNAQGTWGGYDWLKFVPTRDDVARWQNEGANFGILAARYPAVDIDCEDEALSKHLEAITVRVLGAAPTRTGKAPKRLLMYRTSEPFGRMALLIHAATPGDKPHLLEVLGAGRQYLIKGLHPAGKIYDWDIDLAELQPENLVPINKAEVEQLFAVIEEEIGLSYVVERIGDARAESREGSGVVADTLLAPSLEALQEAVALIPNTAKDRDSYIKLGAAVKASWADEEASFEVFQEWASKWSLKPGAGSSARDNWRRILPPFLVGWPWLAEQARVHGFNDAATQFAPLVDPNPAAIDERLDDGPTRYSDQWLRDLVLEQHGGELRYVNALGRWYVWDGRRWAPDAVRLADNVIGSTLRVESAKQSRIEGTKAAATAMRLGSHACLASVRNLVESEPRVAAQHDNFDIEPMLLNTPSGIIDLKTGEMRSARPEDMVTKMTRVPVDREMKPTRWLKFLEESTGGDTETIAFLQKVAGYCLTGLTREQVFFFLYGGGGNGKGLFVNTLRTMVGDYGAHAEMTTFTEARFEKHSTELAGLMGARFVTASETEQGKRWNEARIKALSGGDKVRARFMRQDDIEYMPQFKLMFMGNHKPEIRGVDDAMRRRVRVIPFVLKPEVVDLDLGQKLEAEMPAILAWAIDGCLAWQRDGLGSSGAVTAETEEYFEEQDGLGRWLEECCEKGDYDQLTSELWGSWQQWADVNREYIGKLRGFSQNLASAGFEKKHQMVTRRSMFKGLRLRPPQDITEI